MRGYCVVVLAFIGLTRALPAQEWRVSTEAGRIRSALDPAPGSPSISLGLRYEDPTTGLRVTGGVPTGSQEPLWGGIGASKRLALRAGSLTAGVDLLAHAFTLFDRTPNSLPVPGPFDPPVPPNAERNGYALAGQALPMVGYEGVRFQARARTGLSGYGSRIAGQERDRAVHVSEVQLTYLPSSSLALSPIVQRYLPTTGSRATFVGASAIAASSSGSVWAMAGRWIADSIADPQWSAGARLRLHPNLSLEAMARRTTLDPLYLQAAQTSWSVGMSMLLGRARTVSPPVPAAYSGGRALIRLPVSASETAPFIAGDFNGWKPAPMHRNGNQWTYTVAVAPGVYHYAFVSSEGEWFVPKSVPGRKDDGMGGHVAVLVVR